MQACCWHAWANIGVVGLEHDISAMGLHCVVAVI